MAAHSIPSHAHNAVDLSAVLANTSTKLRNESLLSALVHKTHQLPAMFVEAEDQRPMLEMDGPTLATSASIPIVDMSVLSSSDPAQRASLVANIAEACEKFGFFQVVNHGVDESLIHRCEMEAHKMFELPLDVKERVHRPPGTSFGYGANTWINQTVMHWAESFHMQLHPQSNIKEFSGKLFAESDPTRFSSTVEEYMGQIETLARQLLELLTEGLGLEPTRFNRYVENERMMSMHSTCILRVPSLSLQSACELTPTPTFSPSSTKTRLRGFKCTSTTSGLLSSLVPTASSSMSEISFRS